MADAPITPKGKQTRKKLIAAARRVMAREGYSQMRMADVAVEAGLSLGALYRYFANKEDLFATLVGDIHQDLYSQSVARDVDFAREPYRALYVSNKGYLTHYSENRDVLKVLMEVMTVDAQFLDIWWNMRQRHILRFLSAMRRYHRSIHLDEKLAQRQCEAVVSMVEMSAYAWFAQDRLNAETISIDDATRVVTDIWYNTFFKGEAGISASQQEAS
ncbi:MAG: TetR/AcrR family transcriptional regulator [Rhodobacteraceae bacterium]|nr:TetR/AcrR family transcriptional regulator [Paracoccaceae bacterium]